MAKFCPHCGSALRSERAAVCLSCGQTVAPTGVPSTGTTASTNGLAIASLIAGLMWFGGIGSILAIVFGHHARSQIQRTQQEGEGYAIAGIVLGWLGVAVIAVLVALLLRDRST